MSVTDDSVAAILKKLGVPAWGKLVICGVVALFALAFFGDRRLGKIEDALRALNSHQDDATKELVKELLSQAITDGKSGQLANAERGLQVIPVLLRSEASQKKNAGPAFFSDVTKQLDALSLSVPAIAPSTLPARVSLAQYRTSLPPNPLGSGGWMVNDSPTGDMFVPKTPIPFNTRLADLAFFGGIKITGGHQALDGMHLKDVTFYKVIIRYSGGPVWLEGVRFIDCTFDIRPQADTRGLKLADDIALGRTSLSIGT